MAIQTRKVEYTHEGTTLEGFLAYDDTATGPRPGVLVSHAWAGRSPFEEGKAKALAQLGYVGFALDMYGKGKLGTSKEENSAMMTPFMEDRKLLQSRLQAALQVLREQPEVDKGHTAIMGYCFGGLCAMDLARTGADILGAISFHGLPTPPGNTKKIQAKMLIEHGWADPMGKPEAIVALAAELTAAGADWQLHAYGNTMHAFTNPAANDPEFGTVYNPDADRRSWQTARNFFEELFG
ncbi:MAG: dienelactone hydrolase family protein [Planctomycetes bacterium]|nr:dienelactone hydrolase family protein [Planctomycetota bacterium]MCB9912889.1 dienelactone hydrolase family protein [Planctomycetota bacterium]HRV82228.1 dienelactone hydrolase family protein [Planctomycetota bacterium]